MKRFSFLILTILAAQVLSAQGTLDDFRRAEVADTMYANKVFRAPSQFNWLFKQNRFWYMNRIKGGKEFILADAEKKTKAPAFDHDRLAKALGAKLKKPVTGNNLPFETFTLALGGYDGIKKISRSDTLSFVIDSVRWQCLLGDYTVSLKERIKRQVPRYWGSQLDEKSNPPVVSPDSVWVALIKNSNVYIRNRKTKEEIRLSFDGSEGEFYSAFMKWSPDSKKIAAYKVRPGENHLIYLVESSPATQLQPKLQTREYLKPGDALPVRMPQLFLVDEKKQVPVQQDLFNQAYRVSSFEWRKDSRAYTLEYNQRGHQRYVVAEIQAPTGKVNVLIDEQSKTFIDYAGKVYRDDVNDGKEIIWASERDGWNHLYLIDGQTGKVKNQITKGSWVVRRVEKVDHETRTIIFAASGMDAGNDPYFTHFFRIKFDGTGMTRLTSGNENHNAILSEDGKYFIDVSSRVDLPPTSVLRRTSDGDEVMSLEKADVSALTATGWVAPEVMSAKGRDGQTDIWGIIIRPSKVDPSRKYPVIEYIYAGPHSSHVPKTFGPTYRNLHALAELGFIIVQMDGMGTSNRSKTFHDVCWKNLKDAGFPDRILWIKEAAKRYPYMDTDHVGIFGNSAGGQNSCGALLFHPEFYKVAVSSSGCHDNRMDKIWWNELWMSYPIGPQYAESSNVTHAAKLQGDLMLILGELDDNVDPSSSFQLVNALIKAKKNFDFLFVPGMGHSSGGDYGERKRRDFFVKHLLGVEPPDWKVRYAAPIRSSTGN